MSAADGKRLGKYMVGKTLGRGAFSKVKLGVDTTNNREVAIKIISKEQLARANQQELLRREVYVMKTLDHPNIVKMIEVFQTSNHIYLILELVAGGDFLDLILAKKSLPEAEARYFFQQIVVAVHYCHSRGVAHRDLKPQNMLLDKQDPPQLRVSDFGLANLAEQTVEGLMQSLCGTPDYVAPEVISDGGYDGMRADVWSLGVILYIMFTCRPPFNHSSVPVMFERIKTGEFKMDPRIPAGAQALVKKLIVVDVSKRATLDEVLVDPWFSVDFEGSQAHHAYLATSGAKSGSKGTPVDAAEPTDAQLAGAVSNFEDPSASPKGGAMSPGGAPLASPAAAAGADNDSGAAVHFRLGCGKADAVKLVEEAATKAGCVVKAKVVDGEVRAVNGSCMGKPVFAKGPVGFSIVFEPRAKGTAATMLCTRGHQADFMTVAATVSSFVSDLQQAS